MISPMALGRMKNRVVIVKRIQSILLLVLASSVFGESINSSSGGLNFAYAWIINGTYFYRGQTEGSVDLHFRWAPGVSAVRLLDPSIGVVITDSYLNVIDNKTFVVTRIGNYKKVTNVFVGSKPGLFYFIDDKSLLQHSVESNSDQIVQSLSPLVELLNTWYQRNSKDEFFKPFEAYFVAIDELTNTLYFSDPNWNLFSYNLKTQDLKYLTIGRSPQVVLEQGKGSSVYFTQDKGIGYFYTTTPSVIKPLFAGDIASFKIHGHELFTVSLGRHDNLKGVGSVGGFSVVSNGVVQEVETKIVPSDILLIQRGK